MPSVREGLLKAQPSRLMQFLQPYIDRFAAPAEAAVEHTLRSQPALGGAAIAAKGLAGGLLHGGDVLRRMGQGEDVGPRETLPLSLLAMGGVGRGGLGAGPRLPRGRVPEAGLRGKTQAQVDAENAAVSRSRSNVPVELGTFKSTTPLSIVRAAKKSGGHSVSLLTGKKPTEGFMVGKYPNTDPRTRVVKGPPTVKEVKAFAEKHKKALSKPENYLGVWSEEGKTYIEVSKQWEPKGIRPATKAAEKAEQISMYDAGTGGFPPVGSYPGFITGEKTPEGVVPYAQRLQEMGASGREYMQGHPLQEWWKTPNMTRVYGEKLQPQTRGLLAATSTNAAPPPNVETMSEYMRRVIKGEPMAQPDYTVPPTALFRKPGSKIGLEKGRLHNLEAAARGDLGAMRGPVVTEKVQALQGDPLAIVLDRIHVRATEQPSAGIFAMAEEGKTPIGKDRQLIKDTITEQARIAGETPSVFSANVWAGLREHVKKHGELYGTELKGTQRATLATESKSYDDIFMDKVRAKAKHLGITVKQMEKKLRSGDAELLSFLLGTPFVAEAYRRFRSTGEQ